MRRSLFVGILTRAASMGRRSPCGLCPAWLGTCMVKLNVFWFRCGFQVRFSPMFKGTPRAVPDNL
jgi:hypothetical protein